ncbi:hypothetical protein BpHYR1_016614 [Brachionus plicatilis]|uniref:Uncharacterized protein n=1 Tax=Brachionus plicatilis TaxID=10195 RepID=A0A3M7SKF8_BRAPC|nr:hypothetical protein BpHYR1_016614 [Brachionus plicatilis]
MKQSPIHSPVRTDSLTSFRTVNASSMPSSIGCFPVVECEPADGLDAEQLATVDVLGAKAWLERLSFLEIFEYFYGVVVPDGVLGRVIGPNELLGRTVGLVAQCHRSVDYVLAVAARHHKASIGVVGNGLRVDVTGAHVLDV